MAVRLREAMAAALYGADGFFRRERPADHFRTSVTASPVFATAIAHLVAGVDKALGHPDVLTVVDVGAGRGELLSQVYALIGRDSRVRPVAVELADRPAGLDPGIDWRPELPEEFTGLLIATEWLDNVPLDVAVVDPDGVPRYLLDDGSLGTPLDPADAQWTDEWWPLHDPGDTAEIGLPRDRAWADAVSRLTAGLAVAIDYGHTRADRRPTLTGFRDGREVEPRFDGSTDITAHVAVDALGVPVLRQREALATLGVDGARPPLDLATADPAGYLRALSGASQAAELLAEGGLGDHWWAVQTVTIEWTPWRLSQSWTR
ncbi:SAM-dependent MidA family methyltransferase [Hamadaea flava]|uniref:SAM-dependent methyltransferase n=1 Tax=Hamadaea flava TaxID=1742688 RepID=A0ABV8LH08_9ACTN|nr:SAM-dependent methyltransferase [Hamadaea flava]MCP2326284.1 SAM-dependent MidA family methyltransferase [Hamadaea flava]